MTDWKALCEELLGLWDAQPLPPYESSRASVIARARAALTEPEPEVVWPTDEELLEINDGAYCPCTDEVNDEDDSSWQYTSDYIRWLDENGTPEEQGAYAAKWLRAVFNAGRRHGHQPAPPAEGEVGELGELGELVQRLRYVKQNGNSIPSRIHWGLDDGTEHQGSIYVGSNHAADCARAADLLEQCQAAPVPALAGELLKEAAWLRNECSAENADGNWISMSIDQALDLASLLERQAAPVPVAVSERLPELRGMFERILCVARSSDQRPVGNIELADRLIKAVMSWAASGGTLAAEPVVAPAGPTDEELMEAFDGEFAEFFDSSDGFGTTAIPRSEWIKVARAVLARWGRPAPAPAGEVCKEEIDCETCGGSGTIDETLGGYGDSNPAATCPDCDGIGVITVPAPVPAGEVAELVAWLRAWARGTLEEGQPATSRSLTRAADLLEQRHPAPVPVAERPWERDGWCDEQGRCWFGWHRPMHILNPNPAMWMLCSPDVRDILFHQACLPFNALPLPAGEVEP